MGHSDDIGTAAISGLLFVCVLLCLGVYIIKDITISNLPFQDRTVVKKVMHPQFNARNLAYDYALLFVNEDFELARHVDTVCLPQPGELFDEDRCVVTGWGKDEFGRWKSNFTNKSRSHGYL